MACRLSLGHRVAHLGECSGEMADFSVLHLVLVSVEELEGDLRIIVAVTELLVSERHGIELVVEFIDEVFTLKELMRRATNCVRPVDLKEVGGGEVALEHAGAVREVDNLKLEADVLLGSSLFFTTEEERSTLKVFSSSRGVKFEFSEAFSSNDSGVDNKLGESSFVESNLFVSAIGISVNYFKAEAQYLPKVADHIEVILPVRVKIVLDDLSSVHFTPFSLRGEPLHLEDNLAIRLVTT
jgi:hypothetical protein